MVLLALLILIATAVAIGGFTVFLVGIFDARPRSTRRPQPNGAQAHQPYAPIRHHYPYTAATPGPYPPPQPQPQVVPVVVHITHCWQPPHKRTPPVMDVEFDVTDSAATG